MSASIYGFVFGMWVLLLIGGGIAVVILGPINFPSLGDLNSIVSSGLKAIISICLVVLWIFVLSKMKKRIFHKQIKG